MIYIMKLLNRFLYNLEHRQKMTQFQITKLQLIQLMELAQDRKFAEEVEELQKRGNDIHWLIQALQTHQKKGISIDKSHQKCRVQAFGSNKKDPPPLPTFCQLFKQALDDFILKILIFASILSIIVEVAVADSSHRSTAWIEGAVILLAVAIVGLVTAANNYSKQRQFQDIKEKAEERKRVTVIRDGTIVNMHQDDVLVGDIVEISEGMEVPADAIILEANEVTTDESAMTGESDPVAKNVLSYCISKMKQIEADGGRNGADKHQVPSPFLMSGTKILTGDGRMMIIVVGFDSCMGKISYDLNKKEEDPQTPLQKKLQILATDIGKFGLVSAIIILTVLLIRFGVQKILNKNWDSSVDIKTIISYFILALTVVVVAIPQGLPLSVTLSLAVSVQRMLEDKNLVKKMSACQTMGGANNICSDKTGTLTMNKMTLTKLWMGKTVQLDFYKKNYTLSEMTKNQDWLQLFRINSCVNSSAMLYPEEKGSSTEIAILKFMEMAGIDYSQYRDKYVPLQKFPFSSSRKRMSAIVELENKSRCLFVKGASEMVLNGCNKWFDPATNRIECMSTTIKDKIEDSIREMAQSSLRTLCLAYKPITDSDNLSKKDEKGVFQIEKSGLIVLCIVGVRDVPREEVPEAIRKCHKAGIKVRMVTGDNIVTATAIAKDVGIIRQGDDSIVMEGSQFIQLVGGIVCKNCRTKKCDCLLDPEEAAKEKKSFRIDTIQNGKEFDKIKDNLLVLARSRPEDKYALVTGLRERGEVVATTGDGTNDAPALKKADVGFAMGITGTEVAREAAAIILVDDNFNSIVKAVLWGRNIYDSIRKFIQFQLTINVVAVLMTLIGAAFIKQQVFAPIQMLWINLIMDTLASLALATEAPSQELLNRPPNRRHEHIVSRNMMKHIIGQTIFQLIVLCILVFSGERYIPEYMDSYDSTEYVTHPEWKWHNGVVGGTVCSGRLITISGDPDYETAYNTNGIPSRHITFVFNVFVMMQIFNFINCRKIHDEINIFQGITKNMLFIVIVFVILILQIVLVTFGGSAFHVYSNYGLTYQHWIACILIGTLSLPINLLLKIKKLEDKVDEEEAGGSRRDIIEKEKTTDDFNLGIDPTKDELGTDSHIVKVREFANNPSKFSNIPSVKYERQQIIEIGFH